MGSSDTEVIAFCLVIGAGMSTCLGAGIVYSETLTKLTSKDTLAAGLGISAGVMLYVSFVEIMVKSFQAFEDSGESEANARLYGTLCFFCGFIVMYVLDWIVHRLDPDGHCVRDAEGLGQLLDGMKEKHRRDQMGESEPNEPPRQGMLEFLDLGAILGNMTTHDDVNGRESALEQGNSEVKAEPKDVKLERMGLLTALAIGIHNLPEGLATFVAAVDDPAVGAALAVAIALHNIPEGVCVSVPIFFATGDRHKAFLWAFLSGVAEIVGAGIGWAILARYFEDVIYATLFGLVSGMMVYICIYQLIPTAHRYDPHDRVTSSGTVAGMAIMALSLILFLY